MTEAERIEKDAEDFANSTGEWIYIKSEDPCAAIKNSYIVGATAENSRLQQQLKEKETERSYWLNLAHETQIELKSAQELNREYCELLNDFLSYLGVFKPDWKEGEEYLVHKIQSLINKAK